MDTLVPAPTRIFPNLFCPTAQLSIKRMEQDPLLRGCDDECALFGRVFSYFSSHGSEHTGAVEDVSCLSQKMVICHCHDCWREETPPPATILLFFPQSWKWEIAHLETKLIFLDPILHFHEYRRESKKYVLFLKAFSVLCKGRSHQHLPTLLKSPLIILLRAYASPCLCHCKKSKPSQCTSLHK